MTSLFNYMNFFDETNIHLYNGRSGNGPTCILRPYGLFKENINILQILLLKSEINVVLMRRKYLYIISICLFDDVRFRISLTRTGKKTNFLLHVLSFELTGFSKSVQI